MSVFAIEGELSIYRAAELKTALLGALGKTADAGELELDLSQVSEMDSSGLQLLLLAAREARGADKRLRLSGCSLPVSEVLELCGVQPADTGVLA